MARYIALRRGERGIASPVGMGVGARVGAGVEGAGGEERAETYARTSPFVTRPSFPVPSTA